MKSAYIKQFGGPEVLKFGDLTKPIPKENEVLIKVSHAGVNPVDWKIRDGALKDVFDIEFPLIPGWDLSGVIEEVNDPTSDLKVGDEVYAYCRKPKVKWGTYCEYTTFPAKDVVKKPDSLSLAEAAAIPLVGLTAWQALFDFADLQAGQTILIHAGAGGVGGMAIQFAKSKGAKVITTASASKHPYVKKMGADIAIDYRNEEFTEVLDEPVDVIFDCVGGETLQKSYSCVKKGGVLVTICDPITEKDGLEYGIRTAWMLVEPNGSELKQIATLFDEGKISTPKIEEYLLSEANVAQEKSKEGHTTGKIVLKIVE